MMDKNVIAKRYAVAIFETAKAKGNIDEIREALNILNSKYLEEDIKIFFTNPIITNEEKKVFLKKMFPFLGEDAQNVLNYVVSKDRIEYISLIRNNFLNEVYKEEGKLPVIAVFAKELSESQKNKLIKKLEEKYRKKIVLNLEVDESIIGGGILKIGNKVINGSIKYQLEDMKRMF